MFKKKCKYCGKKINRDFDFCPYCGKPVYDNKYGLLGKNDEIDNYFEKDPFRGLLNPSFLNKMIGGTIKILEKELAKEMRDLKKEATMPKTNFELYVNGKKIDLDNQVKKQNIQTSPPIEILQKAAKLPRKEAQTELKRLGNKIIYEVKVPGVKTLDRILVTKLEDSIEIKAFSDYCVYVKKIPIKLLLIKYYLKDESLFLEFQTK